MNTKYVNIYNELLHKIESGELKVNTLLPSENELKETYGTSRETIRKALNLLAEKGYIQKMRGKGSIVIETEKLHFPVSGLVSFKELANKMNEHVKTTAHTVQCVTPPPYIRKQLDLRPKELVWEVIRTREINGQRVILDKDYFHEKVVRQLTRDICENSIYEYLEKDLSLCISFAKKEVVVEDASEEDLELLDLEHHHNVVVIRNYVYLENATLFQYTESRHRPDKFKFVDFARRSK